MCLYTSVCDLGYHNTAEGDELFLLGLTSLLVMKFEGFFLGILSYARTLV